MYQLSPSRHIFCTYFDSAYLTRGISLYNSLTRHLLKFQLYILCLDQATFDNKTLQALPNAKLVSLDSLESFEPTLTKVKADRSKIEYYFTLTPIWLRYVLTCAESHALVTYLDSDLYFFSSPRELLDSLSSSSIGLVEHRFSSGLGHLANHGRFNVGWVSASNNAIGKQFADWWGKSCLEWCFDRIEGEKYADQKYLDGVPMMFSQVQIIDHPGANVGLWNLAGVEILDSGDFLLVNGRPLVFYHFHGLRRLGEGKFGTKSRLYGIRLNDLVRARIYLPYLRELESIETCIRDYSPAAIDTKEVRNIGKLSSVLKSLDLSERGILARWTRAILDPIQAGDIIEIK